MSIVVYISGHGFGHASRDVEVINAIHASQSGHRIILRTAVDAALLSRTLRGPCDLRPGACDTGVVQHDSITHDDQATIEAAIAFYATLDARAGAEAAALASDEVAMVIGDIPPLAFLVAARLRVPSVAIANFTWDWIYEAMPALAAGAPWILRTIRDAYRQAGLALELPLAGGLDVFPRREPLPFIARRATRTRDETRAHFHLPLDRPLALLSFGGYGLPSLDLARIDCRDSWTVATTDRTGAGAAPDPLPHVVRVAESGFIDSGFRYEDLVAAADVVVTKPGYGIIAECAAAGTALVYTSRGAFREYDVLVREMPRYVRAGFISQPDLFGGRWAQALDAVGRLPSPARPAVDGGEIAAARILGMLR